MKWNNGIKKKRNTPYPYPPQTIPPKFYPTVPPSLGSYKVNIFCLFPIKS